MRVRRGEGRSRNVTLSTLVRNQNLLFAKYNRFENVRSGRFVQVAVHRLYCIDIGVLEPEMCPIYLDISGAI